MSKVIGYTTGVFDLFHIGHLNILRNARERCDRLIVGVTTDELARSIKNRDPIIPFDERSEIVENIRFVDSIYPEASDDKVQAWHHLKFNVIFKGDDWKGTAKWTRLEEEFSTLGVKVEYFEYTKSTSSTKIREIVESFDNG